VPGSVAEGVRRPCVLASGGGCAGGVALEGLQEVHGLEEVLFQDHARAAMGQ